jgi:hypothetical protein
MTEPTDKILVTDQDGNPAVLDLTALRAQGRAFACELAATCDDPAAHDRLSAELVAEGAPEFVVHALTAAALACMVREILRPLVEAAEAAGHDLRAHYADTADRLRAGIA